MSLTTYKQAIAETLSDIPGLQTWAYIPRSITTPAAVVMPDLLNSFYIERGTAMADRRANLVIRIYANGENQQVTEALDELIVTVCDALESAGHAWSYVRTPGVDQSTYEGQAYLCADITIDNNYFDEEVI